MQNRTELAISGIFALAAAGIAASFVHREFARPAQQVSGVVRPPVYRSNWAEMLRIGITLGDSSAPVKIVEFADFECPYCKLAEVHLSDIANEFGAKVAVVFVHFPLPQHRFALIAARAADCAGRQGRFGPLHDVLYAKQDSFGLKPWSEYALTAGVHDTAAFTRCVRMQPVPMQVQAGIQLGTELGVRATPTFVINGWQFSSPPTMLELRRTISAILAGREPFARVEQRNAPAPN